MQETSPSHENEPEMLGARRTFKVKRKRMKSKLKFKKASLNATDLMKGEDGERWIVFTHLNYQSVSFFFPVNKKML